MLKLKSLLLTSVCMLGTCHMVSASQKVVEFEEVPIELKQLMVMGLLTNKLYPDLDKEKISKLNLSNIKSFRLASKKTNELVKSIVALFEFKNCEKDFNLSKTIKIINSFEFAGINIILETKDMGHLNELKSNFLVSLTIQQTLCSYIQKSLYSNGVGKFIELRPGMFNSLQKLDIKSTHIFSKASLEIANLPQLTSLFIDSNHNVEPEHLKNISTLTNLTVLNTSSNHLTPAHLKEIQNLTSLTTLDMSCSNYDLHEVEVEIKKNALSDLVEALPNLSFLNTRRSDFLLLKSDTYKEFMSRKDVIFLR